MSSALVVILDLRETPKDSTNWYALFQETLQMDLHNISSPIF